ncbi:hypothetical protein [uncultured Jatrophihabitans sp.]|uniref:hypothetical protein n=1 Tax=uncultured Jatrophihabitans sp. TaxID=1610747 RepID=UPI0035CAFCE1
MSVPNVLGAVAGGLLVVLAWGSVLSVLVVPRRTRNQLNRVMFEVVEWFFRFVAHRLRGYALRDRWLAWQGPSLIMVQLAAWLAIFYVGYALIINAIQVDSVAHAFAQSGSSLFTLGYAGPQGASLNIVDYLAAATGLIVVALQIGYLPTLYGAFNRRETEVRLLFGRAGVPAWGPEILARTRFGFTADDHGAVMDDFYLRWERWAADLSESHTNYPVLTLLRSPLRLSSWLVAIVAVMDSAALWLALAPGSAPVTEARLALRMGFTALRAVADSLGMETDRDPDPDAALQLSYDAYLDGVGRIFETSFRTERTAEEAWPDFRGWRVNYEAIAYKLAARLDAVPAPWTGPRLTGDAEIEPIRPPNRTPTPYQQQDDPSS